jgi:hypothetical protein
MAFDINSNYRGDFYGRDRLGFTTPDVDASQWERPYLTIPYPAPWLPGKRRDDAHPAGAQVVISTGQLVGLDKSGALIPAGYFCGKSALSAAEGGAYCLVVYGADDVGFAINPQTGNKVASAGEYVCLGCPSDAAGATSLLSGDVVKLPNGTVIDIQASDVAFATSCNLIPGGYGRPVGYAVRNVFQYLGGVNSVTTIGGIHYLLDGVNPVGFRAHNYMHEMGTAIATKFVIHVPWIGATLTTLQSMAQSLGLTNYVQTDFSRSFAHFTGALGNNPGDLFPGCSVVASRQPGDAGNYAPYNPSDPTCTVDLICGRVLAVEPIYPILDYANRVRTQFERANEQIGPFREPNAVIGLMGGSATRGIDYAVNLSTNGLFRLANDANLANALTGEAYSYVYIHVSC